MSPASRRRAVAMWFGMFLVLVAWPAQAVGDPPEATRDTPSIRFAPTAPPGQRLLEMVNRTRWENGHLPPLKSNAALTRAAQDHSQDMARNNFFAHPSSAGYSPWERIDAAGYGNWYILAENIAAGQETPAQVLQAWMDSPDHRENLLNPEINEAGIGYVFEADDTYPGKTWGYSHYWTLDMGTRWDAFPLVIAGEAYSTTTRQVQLYVYGQGWATQLRLSNDGATWSAWRPYQSIVTWELPAGDGLKRVYGQIRDDQGVSVVSMDEIWLQETPVSPPGNLPPFRVNPSEAVFIIQQGQSRGQPLRYHVQITASGGGSGAWHASWDQPWLRLAVGSGLRPADPMLILTDRARSLPAGTYTATLSIWGEQGRVEVPVRLYVFPRVYSLHFPLLLRSSP